VEEKIKENPSIAAGIYYLNLIAILSKERDKITH